MLARLDTARDLEYFRHGGIMKFVLRKVLNDSSGRTSGA